MEHKILSYPDIKELFESVRKSCRESSEDVLEGALIDTADMDTIQSSISHMRDIPYNRCGFECSLTPLVNKGDFSLSITREMAESAINQNSPVTNWLNAEKTEEWDRIISFIQQWVNKKSLLYYCINTIYLELDTGNESKPKAPGIFIRLYNEDNNARWYETISLAVLDSLKIDLTKEKRRLFQQYYNSFIGLSRFFQLGIMLSRNDFPIKLVSMGMKADNARQALKNLKINIADYIEEEGWKYVGNLSSNSINISLDFINKIEDRIGIEIENNEKLFEILKWLVAKNYCTIEKLQAIYNWIGQFKYSHETKGDFLIKRNVSHIKLVMRKNCSLQAKIYLEYITD